MSNGTKNHWEAEYSGEHEALKKALSRELQAGRAPQGLWERIYLAIEKPEAKPETMWRFNPGWAFAAALGVILLLVPGGWLHIGHAAGPVLDLEAYLAPVQEASEATSAPAIYHAPPNFQAVGARVGPASLGGYRVAEQRALRIDGEAVRQFVLMAPDSAISLFIASPDVRLKIGANHWVDDSIAGIACKRLNCTRSETIRFSCASETCIMVCKACSQEALALMVQVVSHSPGFR